MLWFFAKRYIKKYKPFVIWITGSVWKTSCRMIIYQILKKYLKISSDDLLSMSSNKFLLNIYTSPKNFNWEYGLSLSILGIENYSPSIFWLLKNLFLAFKIAFFWKKKYDVIILEYWIDHPWEMDFLLNIVKPHIGIITSVDKVHSQYFSNFDELLNEKAKLALYTKEVVFLNYDNHFVKKIYPLVRVDKFLFRTSDHKIKDDLQPDIWFVDYKVGKDDEFYIYSEADIYLKSQKFHIKTNLIGKENMGYIGVGLAILQIVAKRFDLSCNLWENLKLYFELLPGRFSIFEWINDSIIIDSSYNAAPESMRKILETSYNLKNKLFSDRKLILVLWDMRELWTFSEQKHRELAGLVFNIADEVFLVGENMKKFLIDELEKIWFDMSKVKWFNNSIELGKFLKNKLNNTKEKYLIVFKGSQNTIFLEEAIRQILKNKEETSKLPRQTERWIKKKAKSLL